MPAPGSRGSRDDNPPELINVQEECVLAVLVYKDGQVRINNPTGQPREWIAGVLHSVVQIVPLTQPDSPTTEGDTPE